MDISQCIGIFDWLFSSAGLWFSIMCEQNFGFNIKLKWSDIIFTDNVIISEACSLRFFLFEFLYIFIQMTDFYQILLKYALERSHSFL